MKKKEKYIKDLVLGESCEKEPFSLRAIIEKTTDAVLIKIADNSGTITASMPLALAEQASLFSMTEGTVVEISGVYIMEGIERVFKIKALSLCTDFLPAELFSGISAEIVSQCKSGIRSLIDRISHPGYHALVKACLTDDVLDRMAELPATLNSYGKYNGAALVATNAVSHMVLTSMSAYSKRGNSFSTVPPSWNALTAASLLFLYGNVQFYTTTPPYRKTKLGVAMGYTSLLQKMIADKVYEKKILLSDDDLAALLNILKVATELKTSVRATSKDGAILRHMVSLYSDCDTFDWEIATHEKSEDEPYYYSPGLKGYVITPN